MQPEQFSWALATLSADDITSLAAQLRASHASADDLAWWQATLALDRTLRLRHRSVSPAHAAQAAARAVEAAARRGGVPIDAPDVIEVTRAARDVSRTLVAADADADPCFFLRGWEPILAVPAWAPCSQPVAA